MTESVGDVRQRVDNMIDTLRSQRDAAEAKLAAIRELCDAYDFDTDNIEPAQLRRILDGSGT